MDPVGQSVFYLFSLVALASALLFVTRKGPVAAALWLVSTMFAIAGLYILLDAQFGELTPNQEELLADARAAATAALRATGAPRGTSLTTKRTRASRSASPCSR